MENGRREYINFFETDELEKLDERDRKIISAIIEKLKDRSVKWEQLDSIEQAFLKNHNVEKEVIMIEDIKYILQKISNHNSETFAKILQPQSEYAKQKISRGKYP